MAADAPAGPKNQPRFLGTGAPSTAADENIISDYAAKVGSRMVDTSTARAGLAAADKWEGLLFYETDTGITYKMTGGAWKVWFTPVTAYTPTLTGLTLGTGGTVTGRYQVTDGVTSFWVKVVLGTGAAATGTFYITLPSNADTGFDDIGTFLALGPSGNRVQGVVGLDTTSRFWLLNNANNFLSSTQPWSWQGGHEIRAHGAYINA